MLPIQFLFEILMDNISCAYYFQDNVVSKGLSLDELFIYVRAIEKKQDFFQT